MKDQVWSFDHLGERADIPDFRTEEFLAGAGEEITIDQLDIEGMNEDDGR